VLLTGCDLGRNHLKIDRSANMEFQDFRDALAPRIAGDVGELSVDGGIPSFQSYIADPSGDLKPMPLVSVSINQTIPLRDMLFELAREAEYDIQLDPRITGSIIFTAREKPFDTIIDLVADMAGLRYTFKDDLLRIELDTPYSKIYKINYLNYIRRNSGSIRNDVSVVSGEGTNTGSSFEAASESMADFWGELEQNMTQLLGTVMLSGIMKTQNDPQITAVAQNQAPVVPVIAESEEGELVIEVQPPQAVLQVQSLPTESGGTGQQSGTGPEVQQSGFFLNKQAGIIWVFSTEKQHKKVAEYLKVLKRSVTAQVLIEAKILEVSLTDEYAAGIDWTLLEKASNSLSLSFDITGAIKPSFDPATAATFKLGYTSSNLTAMLEAISRFGTVRALASPRLTVLNNQSAVLNVATNLVYFEIDIDVTTDPQTGTQTTIDSEIRNIPEGVLINVQPSIDLDTRTISLAIRPTITRRITSIKDPSVDFIAAQFDIDIESLVPVVNVQEVDSVVRMASGEAIIMGGLMQDRTTSEQQGIPILSEIPLFGGLFRTQNDKISKTELVIFLKATILDGSNIDEMDRDLYKMFSHDRHPLDL